MHITILKRFIASDNLHVFKDNDETIEEYEIKREKYFKELKSQGIAPLASTATTLSNADLEPTEPLEIAF